MWQQNPRFPCRCHYTSTGPDTLTCCAFHLELNLVWWLIGTVLYFRDHCAFLIFFFFFFDFLFRAPVTTDKEAVTPWAFYV
jgi:hypothetical protein